MGLRLAGALHWFWHFRGYWKEGRRWLEEALEKAERESYPVSTVARAKVLYGAGQIIGNQGNNELATPLLLESARIFRETGEERELVYVIPALGTRLLVRGEVQEAIALAEEGISICRREENDFALVGSLCLKGVSLGAAGDYDGAQPSLEEGAEVARRLKDGWLLCLPLWASIGISLKQGDYEKAAALSGESLLILKSVDEAWFASLALEQAATISELRGDPGRAAHLYGASEALRETIGSPGASQDRAVHERGMAITREALGEETFEARWAEGRRMTPDEAIDFALEREASPTIR